MSLEQVEKSLTNIITINSAVMNILWNIHNKTPTPVTWFQSPWTWLWSFPRENGGVHWETVNMSLRFFLYKKLDVANQMKWYRNIFLFCHSGFCCQNLMVICITCTLHCFPGFWHYHPYIILFLIFLHPTHIIVSKFVQCIELCNNDIMK